MSSRKPLSLYIHIPFCKSKCAYCDFASFPGREAMWEAYFAALCGEIRAAGDDIHRVETVFFGGGTPSLVPETYIAGALAAAREAFPFAPGAEVSLEANPGTLTMEKLRAYREMGVDRLSIGVQSFDARLLKDIGRIHAPGEAVEAVRMAKAAGFDRYEISNYAKAGFACRHNRVYWRRGEYLGFGCAAHSFFGGERFRNASDLEGYLRGARGLERERVDGKAAREETVMLATRTGEGLSLENWREDFGEDFASGREKVLEELRRAGLLEIADGRVFLTEKGMEVHNAVVLALL